MITRNGELCVGHTLPLETSAVSAVIHRKKQIEVADLAFTEENDFLKVVQQESLVSMLSKPISFGEEVFGVLNAYTCLPLLPSNPVPHIGFDDPYGYSRRT